MISSEFEIGKMSFKYIVTFESTNKTSRGGDAVGKTVRPTSGRLVVHISAALKQVVTAPLPNAWQKV